MPGQSHPKVAMVREDRYLSIIARRNGDAINSQFSHELFSPRKASTLGGKPKKRQARTRWPQVNIAGQGGS
ncbi:hypothetical protein TNCV_4661021 [Trichonephila clavipes]|uniref:Uncharacterized protein n=1 Tax=Trichonephila clavipes TaxID=2585209 RepID=A0A8X6SCT9_TRICX|nr:hypothetical protein TNCV_4661021 [Trichonephila clavipes]